MKKTLGFLLITLFLGASSAFAATDYVRVNQIGYLTSDTKIATAFANSSLSTLTFSVVQYSTNTVLWGPTALPSTSVAYLPFSNVYQLDFSTYQPSSAVTCYIKLSDGTQSVTFGVGPCVYQNTQETALNFFRAQNCGTGNWYEGGVNVNVNCHMPPGTSGFTSDKDGIVVDGPNAGTQIDVEGGWHDSGDWIKFMITTAWVDEVLLFSYQENPTVFQDTLSSNLQANSPNGVPDILDEGRYGLNWIIKMNPNATTFYYDVADGRDHDNFGGLASTDTINYNTTGANEGNGDAYGAVTKGYRAVYGGSADKGGTNNCARAAGALAMGYQIWNASGTGFQDTTFAGTCLTHAENLYALAKSQNTMITDVDDFYGENDMNPELEMAAIQLYKATGTASYLTDANSYATAAGSAGGELDWNQNNFLAHYCLYQVTSSTTVKGYMQADLNADQTTANANTAYSVGYPYVWGTNENLSSLVMMCELWKKMFPTDTTYDKLATLNRDFVLGRNPWGVCFIQGMGTTYPLHPQHNIAMAIYPIIVSGMPIEGPDTYKEYKSQGISLSNGTDPYGAFDNNATGGGWCYHDDNEDYVTNEVTSSQACFDINFFSYLSAQCSVVVATNTPTMTATTVKTSTSTMTSTVVRTSTSTVTNTATSSATQTATRTSTNSSTATPTNTASLTFTSTQTSTNTALANTATYTTTSTLTPTQTNSSTALASTATETSTSSSTSTSASTSTVTNTSTPLINTATQTSTSTLTTTNTAAANTATSTSTNSSTAPANTVTSTMTSTRTPVATSTNTMTNTTTPSVTPTKAMTSTATMTNTSTNLSTATATSTSTSTRVSTSTSTFTRTSTATSTSSATPKNTFTRTETATATPALTNCAGVPAWNGNFVVYRTGQEVGYNGELYECIQGHTSEPNWMPPAVPALWKDMGACGSTPASGTKTSPVIYPNPITGSTANIQLSGTNETNVKVRVYTTAFREVRTQVIAQVSGNTISLSLKDRIGRDLANGLYYVVIDENGSHWVDKILVLR